MSDEIPNGREPALGGQGSMSPSLSMDRLLPGLREALESKNRKERLKTIETLRSSGAPPVVPMLVELLRTTADVPTRQRCAAMLGQVGDERAVEPLVELLDQAVASLRKVAVYALGELKLTAAVDPLLEILQRETDYRVVAVIVASLANIGDPKAITPLVELSEAASEGPLQQTIAAALRVLGRSCDLAQLIRMLNSSGKQIRDWAGERFVHRQHTPQVEHLEALQALLSDERRADVRYEAVRLLSRIDDQRAKNLVLAMLRHTDARMQQEALNAVYNQRIQGALDILFELYDPDVERRQGPLFEAMGVQDDPRVVPFLLDHLESKGSEWEVARCLQSHDREAIAAQLLERFNRADQTVRYRIIRAMTYLNTPRVVEVLVDLAHCSQDEEERRLAVHAVDVEAFPGAISDLVQILEHDPSSKVKSAAIWGLSDNLTSEAETALRGLLVESDIGRLRANALNVLIGQRVPDASSLLAEQLEILTDEAALESLVRHLYLLGEEPQIVMMRHLYETAMSPGLRSEVLGEVEHVRHDFAIPLLLEAISGDPSPRVRVTAAFSLAFNYPGEDDYPIVESLIRALDDEAIGENEDDGEPNEYNIRVCDSVASLLRRFDRPDAVAALAEWNRKNGK